MFGLGSAVQVDTLTVEWPDGLRTEMSNVQGGQFLTIDHPNR